MLKIVNLTTQLEDKSCCFHIIHILLFIALETPRPSHMTKYILLQSHLQSKGHNQQYFSSIYYFRLYSLHQYS